MAHRLLSTSLHSRQRDPLPVLAGMLIERGRIVVLGGRDQGGQPLVGLVQTSAPSWLVADRSAKAAHDFITDLAGRLTNRVQVTSDGLKLYVDAVEPDHADVDAAVHPSDERLLEKKVETIARDRAAQLRTHSPAEYVWSHNVTRIFPS